MQRKGQARFPTSVDVELPHLDVSTTNAFRVVRMNVGSESSVDIESSTAEFRFSMDQAVGLEARAGDTPDLVGPWRAFPFR